MDKMTDKELEEPTMSLEELGKIKTVKVYTQAYVDRQQKRIAELKEQLNSLIHIKEYEPCDNHSVLYAISHILLDQITELEIENVKAKKIIKNLINNPYFCEDGDFIEVTKEELEQAEDFIKEE